MFRKLTLTIATCISVISAFSQIPVWTEGYGSGSLNVNVYSSELGPDNKFLISGALWGSVTSAQNYTLGDGTISTPATPYQGSWSHGFYAKLDTNGVMTDVHFASPPTNEQYVQTVYTFCASQDDAGNIFTAGTTHRNTNIYGSSTGALPGGNQDAYVAKNDANGNPLWLKVFGGNVVDEVRAIQLSEDGRIYVAGIYRGTCDFGAIQKNSTDGWSDGFIAEMDTDGNFLWVKSIGGMNANFTMEMEIDSDGNLYTASTFVQNYELEDGTSYTAPHTMPGVVVVKMDADGNTLWTNHSFGTALNSLMSPVEMKLADDGKVWLGLQHGNTFITQEGDEYTRPHIANATCLIIDTNGSTYNVITPESSENTWLTGIGESGDGKMMPAFSFQHDITVSGEQITEFNYHALLVVMSADGEIDGYGIGNKMSGETYLHFQGEHLYVIAKLSGSNNGIENMDFPVGMDIGMAMVAGNNQPQLFADIQNFEECADTENLSIAFRVEDPEHDVFSFRVELDNDLLDAGSLNVVPGAEEGEYVASLNIQNTVLASTEIIIIANDGYDDGEMTFNFDLLALPELSLESEIAICPGEAFLQSASSNEEVNWNNGVDDGATWYPEQSAMLTAIAMNADGCFVNASMNLTVYPEAHLEEMDNLEVCQGESVMLEALSNESSVIWSNEVLDGSEYTPEGTEELTVTATSINGCESSQSIEIVVRPLPELNAGEDISICFGEMVTLNASHNGISGNWNAEIANGMGFVPEESMSYVFESETEFSCTATDEVFVEVKALPVVSELNDVDVCEGQGITLAVSHDGISGHWNDDYEIDQEVIPANGEEFVFTSVAENGCEAQESFVANVHAYPTLDMPLDAEVCRGSEYFLSATSDAVSIVWVDEYSNNESITVSEDLSLEATASNSFGCATSAVFNITALDLPNVNAGEDVLICEGESFILSGSADGTMEWSNGIENGMEYFPTEDEVLVLTATGENGCMAQDELEIDWNELPEVLMNFYNGVLSASGAVDYEWFIDGELIPGLEADSFEPLETGEYEVVGYSEAGCFSIAESIHLTITSIDENNTASKFSVYPNPASDVVFVQLNDDSQVQLEIRDLEGRLVRSENLTSSQNLIQIGDLSSGIYLIKVGNQARRLIVN